MTLLVDAYGRPFGNQAPAFTGRAEFPGWQPHELYRIDVEVLPKDETSMRILETYLAPAGLDEQHEPAGEARRYWAIEHKLMVGGVLLDVSDRMHLSSAYGITHVLSLDDAHSDDGKVGQTHRACCPFGGLSGKPTIGKYTSGGEERDPVEDAVRWVKNLPADAVVYAHGRLGHMRGPLAAYMVLRVRHGLSAEDAQRRCGRGPASPEHPWGRPLHVGMRFYVDRAIRNVCGG